MPEPDGILASDDGSYSNRPADVASPPGVPVVDLNSLASRVTKGPDRWHAVLFIGILHVLLGAAAVLLFPLVCFGVWFVTISTSPPAFAEESQFREYYFIATALWLYVTLNAILAAALPLGIGIILRRRWGVRGTYVAGLLVASILGALCVIVVWGFQYFDQSGGFHGTFFVVPATLYLLSTVCLWLLARRRF
jgi:hypothetical protein